MIASTKLACVALVLAFAAAQLKPPTPIGGSHSAWADAADAEAPPPLEQQWRAAAPAPAPAPAPAAARAQPRQLVQSGLHDPVGSVQGLITRVLGAQYVPGFALAVIPLAANGNDVFELDSAPGTVIVRGSSGFALAAGLSWYLKYTANCSVSWGRGGSGNNVALPPPASLVAPAKLRMESAVRWRYAYNVCTYGYTMAFWNFTEFEAEIDRLALWGVNLPLAFAAQEATEDRVYRSFGLNSSEINAYLSGPAFLPWQRMGNMRAWGGPLTPDWHVQTKALQVQIVTRMREFGMVPVLAGFAGHVPTALKTHFPNASYTQSSDWCGFDPAKYGADLLLEATDPLFITLGAALNKATLEDFGDPTGKETPVFNADMFNEMVPNESDPAYLAASNAAIFGAMTAANPASVYMMQAWLFHADFWTYDRVKAFLSGVPIGSMIILDLNSEDGPVWNEYDSFFGHSWIWNSLIAYGGRRGIYGNLDAVATSPYRDLNLSATMHGVGFTPEATEIIPSMFDVGMEAGWRSSPIADTSAWMRAWAARRYGTPNGVASPSLAAAYDILSTGAYNSAIDTASLESTPSLADSMSHNTNATGILMALRLFVQAAARGEVDTTTGPWSYDLTDLSRQVFVNLFSDAHAMLGARFSTPNDTAVLASVTSLVALCSGLISELDAALAADQNFLLGHWIADAAAWGGADAEWTSLLVFNARNQITLWGPRGEINDYAAKNGWSGLVGTYYAGRWNILFDAMLVAAEFSQPIDEAGVSAALGEFQTAWGLKTEERPPTAASGASPLALAQALLAAHATVADASAWTALPDTDVALPPRGTAFVHVGVPGQAAVSDDCPFTFHGDGSSLAACEASCLAVDASRCNAVNFSPSTPDCVARVCDDPLHPQLSGGYGDYSYYGLNSTRSALITTAWHRDVGVLSALCAADAACAGFSDSGRLYTAFAGTRAAPGVTLYVKKGQGAV